MKFITEADLRDLYKQEAFSAYRMEADAKLTPGARQFLADLGVKLAEGPGDFGEQKAAEEAVVVPDDCEEKWELLQLHGKMKSIEAQFLLTVQELLGKDADLAQSSVQLKVHYSRILKAFQKNEVPEDLLCHECSGITQANFSDNLGDCFEITEFHMLLKNGRELLILHRLRCELQEIEPAAHAQAQHAKSAEEKMQLEELIRKVNQIINSLSQLICSMVGGEKCKRKK